MIQGMNKLYNKSHFNVIMITINTMFDLLQDIKHLLKQQYHNELELAHTVGRWVIFPSIISPKAAFTGFIIYCHWGAILFTTAIWSVAAHLDLLPIFSMSILLQWTGHKRFHWSSSHWQELKVTSSFLRTHFRPQQWLHWLNFTWKIMHWQCLMTED